jgi:hypothetical protein
VNHGREAYVYASRALKQSGARQMADIIDRCQALVDEHLSDDAESAADLRRLLPNSVIDHEGRSAKDAGSALPEPVVRRIYELSYEFMDYPDNIADLAESYYRRLIEGDDPDMGRRST